MSRPFSSHRSDASLEDEEAVDGSPSTRVSRVSFVDETTDIVPRTEAVKAPEEGALPPQEPQRKGFRRRRSLLHSFGHQKSSIHPLEASKAVAGSSRHFRAYRRFRLFIKSRVIHPEGALYGSWSLAMIVPMAYTSIVTPYYVAKMTDPPLAIYCMDRIADVVFLADMALNFMLAFRSPVTGAMIYDRKKIRQHYLRTGFLLDLLSSVPWDLLFAPFFNGSASMFKVMRILRLMRLVKLLRVMRFSKWLEVVETSASVNYSMLQLIQHIVFVVLATHWLACLMLLFLHLEAVLDPGSSWSGTLELPSEAAVYISAMYFAAYTLTTIGYGDMSPETAAQRVFVTIIMLGGALLYGYIIGAVSALLSSANERKHYFYRTIMGLNKLLKNRHMPEELCHRLRQYFRYKCIFATNMDGMHDLLASMSPSLRREVSVSTCLVLSMQVPCFKDCDESFLMECAMHMEEMVFAPMEVAIVRGLTVNNLTLIRKGVVVARGRVLTRGRVLGEESLYKEYPASYSARSMTFTDASQLHRSVALRILKNYPKLLRSACIRSIQGILREELVAYAEAVQRIREGKQFLAARAHACDLPAPELDTAPPNDRVQHYMNKLGNFLLVEESLSRKYHGAARKIQSQWRLYKWRRTLSAVQRKLQHFVVGQDMFSKTTQAADIDNTVGHLLRMKLDQGEINTVRAARVLPQGPVALHRASLLQVAQHVPGTGITNNPLKSRQSKAQAQHLAHVAQVTPVLRRLATAREQRRASAGFHPFQKASGAGQASAEEMLMVHRKLDQVVESIGMLMSELSKVRGAVLYNQYESAVSML